MKFAITLLPLLLGLLFQAAPKAPDKPAKPLPQTDNTADTIKAYTEGDLLAPYAIALHDDPRAGQYWKVGSDSYGITSGTRWQISKRDGDVVLVEQQCSMSAEMFKFDYVLAFRVNLKAKQGEPQVTRAWIGRPGKAPQLITVRHMPKAKPADKAKADKPEDEGEAFSGLKLAGKTWKGKLYKHVFEDMTTRLWVADDGWFDKIVRVTAGDDYKKELQACGDDAKPLLAWPAKWQQTGVKPPAKPGD